jgi:hypothetical protein
VAAAEPLEESGAAAARCAEPAILIEPAGVQSLHAQGESGKTLGLSLRRGHGQLLGKVDGSTTVAALALVPEARWNVAQASGWHAELLPDQSALRSSRGHQQQHPHADQPRTRLQEHALTAIEGQAYGDDEHRARRRSENSEGRVECSLSRIPAESHIINTICHLA